DLRSSQVEIAPMTRAGFLLAMTLPLIFVDDSDAADRLPPAAGLAGRSVTIAPHGMVCAAHPLAVQIGLDVLKNGGNAVDAVIAALGVMEPMSCGVGGDLFAIVWDTKSQKLYGLNASGRSPYAATREYFAKRGLRQIPEKGPLSWSVPGCVDGWDELRKKFGTRSFAELLQPAIRYAEEGVPVPEVIAGYWKGGERALQRDPGSAKVFLIDGHAPKVGQVFRNPALAASYREIAKNGHDGYYKGPIAERLVAFSQKNGGLFALRDFTEHTSTWIEPVATNYRGYDI